MTRQRVDIQPTVGPELFRPYSDVLSQHTAAGTSSTRVVATKGGIAARFPTSQLAGRKVFGRAPDLTGQPTERHTPEQLPVVTM